MQVSSGWRMTAAAVIVVAAIACTAVAPIVGIFWALVAGNLAFGRDETVPFSTYPMFSQPPERAWSLRVQDPDGEVIRVAALGISPVAAVKRFASDERAELEDDGVDRSEARRRAAAKYARLIEEHRPIRGPLSAAPITIVLTEYLIEAGAVRTVRTPLIETSPG